VNNLIFLTKNQNNMAQLSGKKVAILATNGFEYSELMEPQKALKNAGAEVEIISLKTEDIRGWQEKDWAKDTLSVDKAVKNVNAADYNGLVLPGGVMNPDHLRTDKDVQRFVRDFFKAGKPVAAICHAPWILIDAEVVEGRKLTSYHTLRKDLENAGANWVDKEVVVDQGLVTSRNPNDLPAFCKKVVEEIGEGVHEKQRQSVR